MRIAVYASPRSLEGVAFSDGLKVCGHRVIDRSASDYGAGQVERFDAVVITGLRGKGRTIRDDYAAVGVPVVVIDYGYLARVSGVATWNTGHWQIGLGGLNKPPPFPCPSDRFDALGITIKARSRGGRPVVLGQHVGDPSHGFSRQQMQAWAQRLCDEHGASWRPHPDSPGVEVRAERADGPLGDVLASASVVYTLCSTAGLDALLAGVPAVAEMPERSCWGELSGEKLPTVARRAELCARLAYGQWTIDEMRSGEAAKFVTENTQRWL